MTIIGCDYGFDDAHMVISSTAQPTEAEIERARAAQRLRYLQEQLAGVNHIAEHCRRVNGVKESA